jgi:hypothetical protein
MSTEADHLWAALPRRVRHRRAFLVVARSFLVAAALVVAYFVLPLNSSALDALLELLAGLAVLAGLLAWQIRTILHSPVPAVQAVAALAVSAPLFVVLFSAAYYLMDNGDSDAFSQPLTRLDALYFTVSTFSTVGFGDITAHSQAARGVVTAQMVLGLVLVGLIVRVFLGAVEVARRRQRPDGERGPS